MPRVRPRISWLPCADLSQTPACIRSVFSASRRASTMISPITSSTTLRVLEYGALNTATPRSAAATRSTWLVPMQKQPTASRSDPAASTLSVTVVLERMPSTEIPGSASTSSSSVIEEVRSSTSKPRSSRYSTATGWMFSRSRAFTWNPTEAAGRRSSRVHATGRPATSLHQSFNRTECAGRAGPRPAQFPFN